MTDITYGGEFLAGRYGPGARDQRLADFGQGRWGDAARPSGWLALQAEDVSRPEVLEHATGDELLGVGRAWKSLEGWCFSGKLAVVRVLIRRYPLTERDEPGPEAGGFPDEWDPRLHHEVAAALGISVAAAAKLVDLAWTLDARLPSISAALEDDQLDPARVRMIVDETSVLDREDLFARAEAIILAGLARCKTWPDLERLVQRAVITVDPDGARKRREQAEREHARIRFWREAAGTCALRGTGLPTDQALAATANIEARALEYKAAPVRRAMDILRVMAYLDLINGVSVVQRAAWAQAEDQARKAEADEQAARDAGLREATRQAREKFKDKARESARRRNIGPDDPHHDGGPDDGPDDGLGDSSPQARGPGGGGGDPASTDRDDAGGPGGSFPDWPPHDDPDDGRDRGPCSEGPDGDPGNDGPDGCDGPGGLPGEQPSGDSDGLDDSSSHAGGPGDERDEDPDGTDPDGDPGGNGWASAGPNDGACPECGGTGGGLAIRANLTLPAAALPWLARRACALRDPAGTDRGAPGPDGEGCRGDTSRGGGPGNRASPGGGSRDGPGPCPACGSRGSARMPVRADVAFPLLTLLGLAERPGEAHGLGALDPGLVRDLAAAGARHPASEFCLTVVTDEQGYAIGHGCCKPLRGKAGKASPADPGSARLNPGVSLNPGAAIAPDATLTPSERAGPEGGFESWILTLPGAPLPFIVDIDVVPTHECDHRHASAGYQPSGRLRHLVQVRDGTCSFPACSRHARESDFEHAQPFDKGGPTCACNAHACSRSCHRVKQSDGWQASKPRPGWTQWTTMTGRTYIQGPWRYPS